MSNTGPWRSDSRGELTMVEDWLAGGGQASVAQVQDKRGDVYALKQFKVEEAASLVTRQEQFDAAQTSAKAEWAALENIRERLLLPCVVQGLEFHPGTRPVAPPAGPEGASRKPEDDPPWILLEWVGGKTLKDLLFQQDGEKIVWKQPSLRWRLEVSKVFVQGVADLHRSETIWRDGHLENVMLTDPMDPGSMCFLDFGIARTRSAGTYTIELGRARGYLLFTAPERLAIAGKPEFVDDYRDDVWVTAATLHTVLFLALPFQKDLPSRLRKASVTPEERQELEQSVGQSFEDAVGTDRTLTLPDSAAAFSLTIRRVIKCALRIRPERRFRDAIEFARVLVPALDEMILRERTAEEIQRSICPLEKRLQGVETQLGALTSLPTQINVLKAEVQRLGSVLGKSVDQSRELVETTVDQKTNRLAATFAEEVTRLESAILQAREDSASAVDMVGVAERLETLRVGGLALVERLQRTEDELRAQLAGRAKTTDDVTALRDRIAAAEQGLDTLADYIADAARAEESAASLRLKMLDAVVRRSAPPSGAPPSSAPPSAPPPMAPLSQKPAAPPSKTPSAALARPSPLRTTTRPPERPPVAPSTARPPSVAPRAAASPPTPPATPASSSGARPTWPPPAPFGAPAPQRRTTPPNDDESGG